MKSKIEMDVFESRLDSDCFSTPPAALTQKTNKTARTVLFAVETRALLNPGSMSS
jgi:hypothetical protein